MSDERPELTGPDLDAAVAERVMGWRWVQPPKFDYNGPLPGQGMVLVPPTFNESQYQWPPIGVIQPEFFCRRWSGNISDAFEVVEAMQRDGWIVSLCGDKAGWCAVFGHTGDRNVTGIDAPTLPEAICRAALAAQEHER